MLNFDASAAEKKRDPRLDELNRMGLQRCWLDVAEEIGVDAFLRLWRRLDRAIEAKDDGGRLLIPIRKYKIYLKFQRNRYIEELDAQGVSPADIKRTLEKQLCEQISIRNISRILQKA
ncbi:MAG TPA: hypothetical protein VK149_13330 [Sideroxyarcus sp.]|nr:hypothetical protein [Sideroxyarcus sp.]